jgi:hypothetical protein
MPVGGLRKQRRNRNLAAERRQKPKERIQGYCGSRKRVTVAGRRMTCCVGEASSGIAPGPRSSEKEEFMDSPWKKRGNKGYRRQAAAIPEKEEGNRDRHRRMELKTAITSGKRRTDLQDPQEDPRAGIREANKRVSSGFRKMRKWTLWRG